jgi:hypothetical protein
MRCFEALLPVAVVGGVAASACGGLLGVHEGAGAGSGGQGKGTLTTSSASGGTGGCSSVAPALTCGAVMQATPVLTVDAPDYGNALQPSLVVLASTPPKAAVAYIWQPKAVGPYVSARVASFAGWGTWPPPAPVIANVQDTETGEPLSGISLLAQSNPSRSPPSLDMLYAPTTVNDDQVDNLPHTIWGVGLDGSNPLSQGPGPGTVLFVATGGTDSGVAWPGNVNLLSGVVAPGEGGGAPPFRLVVQFGPNFGGIHSSLGCSTTPLTADAVANEAGWLVAAGLGSPFDLTLTQSVVPPCVKGPSVAVGPGTALTLATINPSVIVATQVVPMASPVTRLRMVNGAGCGTWIVWSLDGEPTLTAGVVSDALTLGTTFPVAAVHGALVPSSFAIESFGGALVVAAVDQVAGSNDQVQVSAMDQSGATLWSATVPTDGTVEGALSVRAAPDGSSLLLAWSELPPGGTTHRIRVARLDCTTCAAGGAACTTGSDCCGAVCEQGTCASPAIGTGTPCTTDADCRGGEACDHALGGTCIGGPVCQSDTDCGEAGVCDTALSVCVGSGDECQSDADCPVGEPCDEPAGRCLPGTCASASGACTSDHDCCSQACDTGAGVCN